MRLLRTFYIFQLDINDSLKRISTLEKHMSIGWRPLSISVAFWGFENRDCQKLFYIIMFVESMNMFTKNKDSPILPTLKLPSLISSQQNRCFCEAFTFYISESAEMYKITQMKTILSKTNAYWMFYCKSAHTHMIFIPLFVLYVISIPKSDLNVTILWHTGHELFRSIATVNKCGHSAGLYLKHNLRESG